MGVVSKLASTAAWIDNVAAFEAPRMTEDQARADARALARLVEFLAEKYREAAEDEPGPQRHGRLLGLGEALSFLSGYTLGRHGLTAEQTNAIRAEAGTYARKDNGK